jgi:hypothetical protein
MSGDADDDNDEDSVVNKCDSEEFIHSRQVIKYEIPSLSLNKLFIDNRRSFNAVIAKGTIAS